MLCQSCGENPATTHIKTIVNGELTELSLCAECAQKLGYEDLLTNWGFNFSSLLGSFFGSAAETSDSQRCKDCGSSFEDIAQSGKVGCAECYHTFYDRLIPSIQRIHGNTKHCGKTPGFMAQGSDCAVMTKQPQDELQNLREQLKEAINLQNFEQAAVLRDKIKELEGGEQ